MKSKEAELRDRLVSEYALGTLTGDARKRFERILMDSPALRQEVWSWEARLAPMAEILKPQAPEDYVWQNIRVRLGLSLPPAKKLWHRVPFWQYSSLAFAMSAILLAVLFALRPNLPPVIDPNYFAMIENGEDQAVWLVNIDQKTGQFEVRAVNVAAQGDKSFELWLLPDGDLAPESMGLLPVAGRSFFAITKPLALQLNTATGLAVSLEPTGGSSTGAPTGPVLYHAKVIKL